MRPPWSNLSSVVALVELLISDARYVLTVDDKRRIIRDGAVAIEDMEIVDVGKSSELKRKYSAAERIDAKGKLVMPDSSTAMLTPTRIWFGVWHLFFLEGNVQVSLLVQDSICGQSIRQRMLKHLWH